MGAIIVEGLSAIAFFVVVMYLSKRDKHVQDLEREINRLKEKLREKDIIIDNMRQGKL